MLSTVKCECQDPEGGLNLANLTLALHDIIQNIPNLNVYPLNYVFEHMKLQHKPNTLWLEFGVAGGSTINYISKFTTDKVYGFDSFEGLPEKWRDGFDKGEFTMHGKFPIVNNNVELIKGWFNETLVNFMKTHDKKISFIHIDVDLYSSTKYVLNTLKNYIDSDCIVVFDELVNYPGFWAAITGAVIAICCEDLLPFEMYLNRDANAALLAVE